jgi:hypothetical protein
MRVRQCSQRPAPCLLLQALLLLAALAQQLRAPLARDLRCDRVLEALPLPHQPLLHPLRQALARYRSLKLGVHLHGSQAALSCACFQVHCSSHSESRCAATGLARGGGQRASASSFAIVASSSLTAVSFARSFLR